jgi:hypothetical protein
VRTRTCEPAHASSLIALPAALVAFLVALLLALGFLRRSFVLTMRGLLTLDRASRFLLLILRWRTALLRGQLGCGRPLGRPLNVSASISWRLSAWGGCGALLEGRCRAGTTLILRRGASLHADAAPMDCPNVRPTAAAHPNANRGFVVGM